MEADNGTGVLLVAGNLCIDCEAHTASLGGRKLDLTHQEFELLRRLVRRRDEIIDRGQLSLALWGSAGPREFKRLTVVISHLREKLSSSSDTFRIESVRFRGYGFLCSPAEGAKDRRLR